MGKNRDLKREYETAKARGEKLVAVKVHQDLADAFTKRCKQNNTNKNSILKSYIERYTYEGFDQ